MSLNAALNGALSGLQAFGKVSEAISTNVANASTPGYAKRSVALASSDVNAGVGVTGTIRADDMVSDYAAQLAQFSMVEQQVFTNDQLASLNSTLGGSAINALSGWIGMEVRATSAVRFDGAPITVSPAPSDAADRADLVVFNDFGSEVARRDIPISNTNYIWDGRDQTGRTLGTGTYSFTIDSFADGELIASDPAQIYARVLEAQIVDGDTVLGLEGGATVPASQISALRAPE